MEKILENHEDESRWLVWISDEACRDILHFNTGFFWIQRAPDKDTSHKNNEEDASNSLRACDIVGLDKSDCIRTNQDYCSPYGG
jgi:hypothetical protein